MPRTLVFTFQRAVGNAGGQTREGRWLIIGLQQQGAAADVVNVGPAKAGLHGHQIAFVRGRLSGPCRGSGTSRDFQLRELGAQRLRPHRVEPHDELDVVVERFDAQRPSRCRTADDSRAGPASALPARTGPRLRTRRPACSSAPCCRGNRPACHTPRVRGTAQTMGTATTNVDGTSSISVGGISSMKRDGSLDWYSPKTRRRAADVSTSRRCARVMPT